MPDAAGGRTAVLLKGYPRISETFIARELLELQERGFEFLIVSLRHPTDRLVHDLHTRIRAPCLYLPEYLHQEPMRVLRSMWRSLRLPGLGRALMAWLRDLPRDPSRNRIRRAGQAVVLAAELPKDITHLHAHFIHTPASVARYAALLRGGTFSISAHAKDIWTTPAWEKREKLSSARWTVTCTAVNARHLRELAPDAKIELLYHGVDATRFTPRKRETEHKRTPILSISVARCVPKKGLDILVQALAQLPSELDWRHVHIGDGPLLGKLRAEADALGLGRRIEWRGTAPQLEVAASLARADLFVLPCRIAADGDRDGLPNVLLEAMSCGLPVVTTTVSAVPELVVDGCNGLLVPPDDPQAVATALARLICEPELRAALGREGRATVENRFNEDVAVDRLAELFELPRRLACAA